MGKFKYSRETYTTTPDPADGVQAGPDEPTVQRETPPHMEQTRTVQDECEPVSETGDAFAREVFARFNSLESAFEVLVGHIQVVDSENRGLKEEVHVLKEEVHDLKEEIHDLKEENQLLEGEVQLLKGLCQDGHRRLEHLETERNSLIKRESLSGFYRAFGHQRNTARPPTHNYLLTQGPFLQKTFSLSQKEINDLLDFLDSTQLAMEGNDAAHNFTLADAMAAVGENEPPLRKFVEFLVRRYGEDTEIAQAAEQLEEELAAENEMTVKDWRKKCKLTSN